MILETFPSGPFETNTYIIGCPLTSKAFVVDVPPQSAKGILEILKKTGLSLDKILLTHSHWDHISDVSILKKATGAEVLVHPLDADNLQKPGSDKLPMFFSFEGITPDGFLKEGDVITVGSIEIEVLFTPGHTPGGVSFYLPKEKTLFSGDTLFKGTMGRVDFPTSSPKLMWASLKKLSDLPKDTKVFPGHGAATLIGKESWIATAEERFN